MLQTGRKIHIILVRAGDFISAIFSWIILYFTRRLLLNEPIYIDGNIFLNNRFWLGYCVIPAGLDYFLCADRNLSFPI